MLLEEIIKYVSGADKGSLITIDEHGDVRFESVVGFDLEAAQSMTMKLEDTFLFKAIDGELPKSIVITDIAKKNESVVAKNDSDIMDRIGVENVKATICVPITLDKQLFGMINIDSESVSQFDREDIELIELFSDEVSKVVKLYTLFEKTIIDSKYDGLTGLFNRSTFKQRIHRLQDAEYIIVYYDLDRLKVINDTYGHDIGDLYLNHFVEGINKQILGKEIFSRFGGDEFVLCFCRSKETFYSFVDKCEKYFEHYPLVYNQEVLKVDYSHGEAYYKEDSEDVDELIKIADKRMYDYKLSKRQVTMKS
jgi:diguanylate cyclase (GGDEF)-like protein